MKFFNLREHIRVVAYFSLAQVAYKWWQRQGDYQLFSSISSLISVNQSGLKCSRNSNSRLRCKSAAADGNVAKQSWLVMTGKPDLCIVCTTA